ncbi:ATP synthase F1 subunit epsilon [Candidatus Uhrbacteria bacterium]|nr:ATP synthase F1 subunit epsilon [Candidatus Uhrbacteria bacterium]
MPLHFELVTLERTLFKEEALQVTLPTTMGEITVLPGHQAIVASLISGVAHLKRKDGGEEDIAVSGGFIEIKDDVVRVLADTAERGEDLDIEIIEQAKKRAEDIMKATDRRDDNAFAAAAAALERELARYRVANKRRRIHK